jgi:hypothetical protein
VRSPLDEYKQRLDSSNQLAEEKQRIHLRYGNAKLAVIVAGLAVAWLAIYPRLLSPFWLLAPAAAYFTLAVLHNQVNRARWRAERLAAFYGRGIARIEDRWTDDGETGERFRSMKSIYAEDLDVFGPASLFQLLCTARTTMGENCLAGWLLARSARQDILERHEMLQELREKLDFRERLALAGEDLRAELDPGGLAEWAEGRASAINPALRRLFRALAVCLLVAVFLLAAFDMFIPLFAVLIIEIVLTVWRWKEAKRATAGMESGDQGLLVLAGILERIETESFASVRLRQLSAKLREGAVPASRAVARLARLSNWIGARDSLAMRLIDLPLMITMQIGFAAEAWRRRWGTQVRVWLEIVGEIEALNSLAAYAFEHPEDVVPEIVENAEVVFEGEALGHPLIPNSRCVRNSVRLGRDPQVLVVSGSNMSGKSTLLRAVGVNVILALAGAPVRAKALKLAPLSLGTSIRTTDSLQEGRSGFYTEILRLREVFDLTESTAQVLFLFDELLAGTNSRDRRAGAEGLIRALIECGAAGIVTTHDSALTEITAPPGRGAIRNVHFQERINDGQMSFDYVLRDGPVETSNALQLMRMIGLKV